MSIPVTGHVALSAAAPNVVKRTLNCWLNGQQQPAKDITNDPTFPANAGDNFEVQVTDTDNMGSSSPPSALVSGVAQTPPPAQPVVTGVTFTAP